MFALVRKDSARDVAPVERPAHRRESGHAVVARGALLVAEELEDAAEVGLHQPIPGGGNVAAGHPDRDVLRPVAHVVGVPAHVVEHDGMAGEAPECVANGPCRHVAEGHGAPALEGLEAGVGRGRHHGAPHPERHDALVALDERVRVERARPASDSGDGDHLAGLGETDDHGRHARHAHLVAVHHPEGQNRGDPRVDGVAAVVERLECGQGRELVASADDVVMTTGDGHDGHGGLRTGWAGTARRGGAVEYRHHRNRRGTSALLAKNRIAASSLANPRAWRRRRSRPSADSFHSIASMAPAGGLPGRAVTAST